MTTNRLPFRQIWLVDFEFQAPDGERPVPLCMAAHELRSGCWHELWRDELETCTKPPFDTGPDTLFVAYYASAELSCFLALNWSMPAHILDLFAEFRVVMNGRPPAPGGAGLLGAAIWFGLDVMAADTKDTMRQLVLRGSPYTGEERRKLQAYCCSDVKTLTMLLTRMLPTILARGPLAIGHSVHRGRYMKAVAHMEWTGVPVDAELLGQIRAAWPAIKYELVTTIDGDFGVYDGLVFKTARFIDLLLARDIPWLRLASGALALDDGTFRDMALMYPQLEPLRQLRRTLSELRLEELSVGSDGRNRCLLSPFRSRTGRNQPSNSRFIFGPAAWVRGLIRPEPGMALAYCDFVGQEMGVAAALSGDTALLEGYRSGDVYLAFAKQAGLAPVEATKATHGELRDRCKAVVLGTLYGMGAETLARRIGCSPCEASELLRLHRQTYPQFWRWSDDTVASAVLNGWIRTVFDWRLHVEGEFNPRTLANFPMQANGAEIMRLTACLATERRLSLNCPIHDAFMVEAPIDGIEQAVTELQDCMREASRVVLGGFELGSDATITHWPDRYQDPRGAAMWATIMELLARVQIRTSATAVQE